MQIKYEKFNEKHVNDAVKLVMQSYEEERMAVPFLPKEDEVIEAVHESIMNLLKHGNGLAAVSEDKVLGFIIVFEVEELFGKCKGVYSPLYGHGAAKENRRRIYQELYTKIAEEWAEKAFTCQALTFFAHDEESINTWFWQGFGMRCVDAIREVTEIKLKVPSDVEIIKLDSTRVHELAEIHKEHSLYYKKSPIFMPKEMGDPLADLLDWMKEDNHHLWAAYRNGIPVGYMRIEPTAETFVSDNPNVMNITGAYLIEEERKSGTGSTLLKTIQDWLKQAGYPLCGVDYEAINTTGSSFWGKNFIPYTYSLVRRIDERVL